MGVSKDKDRKSIYHNLFSPDFFGTLTGTIIATVLGSNITNLLSFVTVSQIEITFFAAILAVPLAVGIQLFSQWMTHRAELEEQERELSKLRVYKSPSSFERLPSSEAELLITGIIKYNGVYVRSHLYDSGDIHLDDYLCPMCQNTLYHPKSPKPSEVDIDLVQDFQRVNYSNKEAIKQQEGEGGILWALECTSETCDYIRYGPFSDLHDDAHQIQSIFQKHFRTIKNDPKFDVLHERPSIIWEKYTHLVDDEEICETNIDLSLTNRLILKLPF